MGACGHCERDLDLANNNGAWHYACKPEYDKRKSNRDCVSCGQNKVDQTIDIQLDYCNACFGNGTTPLGYPDL